MSAGASSSSANLFRRLVWQSSVPISIRLGDGEPGFGSSCDRYYMRAPRYTYFALLIPEIRENLVELALDDQQLAETEEKDWWLEEETADEADSFLPQGPIRWHWPIDLVHIQSMIAKPHKALSTSISPPALRLILHLSAPPNDKLLMPNSIDACKTQYINQLKEADFVRWRNTNKVTNLRKADLDGGWEGLVSDDYDLFMRMATRLFPLPIHTPSSSIPSRPPSADPGSVGASKPESSYTARALPIKFYLPDGAPVVQEVIPPLLPDGSPQTILGALRQYLPLLFPSTSYTLAIPIIQGVEVPPESELAWLSSCMCGVDGWLRVGIQIRAD